DAHLSDCFRQDAAANRHDKELLLPAECSAHLFADTLNCGQVDLAICPAGRADADEADIAFAHGEIGVGRRAQAPPITGLDDEFLQPRLAHRRLTGIDQIHLVAVGVDTDDPVAGIRETCRGHRSYIAQSEHANLHPFTSSTSVSCTYRVLGGRTVANLVLRRRVSAVEAEKRVEG